MSAPFSAIQCGIAGVIRRAITIAGAADFRKVLLEDCV
jgi:hypothetical protein